MERLRSQEQTTAMTDPSPIPDCVTMTDWSATASNSIDCSSTRGAGVSDMRCAGDCNRN